MTTLIRTYGASCNICYTRMSVLSPLRIGICYECTRNVYALKIQSVWRVYIHYKRSLFVLNMILQNREFHQIMTQ